MVDNISSAYYRASATANAAIGQAIVKHGAAVTYEHIMAELAEATARELPEGTHYLREAVTEADTAREAMKAEQVAWDLARESGWYGLGRAS